MIAYRFLQLVRAIVSYPLRHWRGELGLGVTFWVNVVALTVALFWLAPGAALKLGLLPTETARQYTGTLLISVVQNGLVPLWQMVGLWRASGRRVAETGGYRFWIGRGTQVAAVLFTLFVAMRVLLVGTEQLISSRVAYAYGPYDFTVKLLPSGRELEVSGGIGFGVAGEVQALLAKNPQVRRIRLNSGGGALSEAQRLRTVIQEHGLDTFTTRGCSSACVSAFAGGRFRYLQRGAKMGVHLPRNWQPLSRGPLNAPFAAELAYLQKLGLANWFIAAWIRTGQQFWFPGEVLLLRSGMVSAIRGRPPAEKAGAKVEPLQHSGVARTGDIDATL